MSNITGPSLQSPVVPDLSELSLPIDESFKVLGDLAGMIAIIGGLARLVNKVLFPRNSN